MIARFEGPDSPDVLSLASKECGDWLASLDNGAPVALPKGSSWVFKRALAPATVAAGAALDLGSSLQRLNSTHDLAITRRASRNRVVDCWALSARRVACPLLPCHRRV